jgi:hypothetical protein
MENVHDQDEQSVATTIVSAAASTAVVSMSREGASISFTFPVWLVFSSNRCAGSLRNINNLRVVLDRPPATC